MPCCFFHIYDFFSATLCYCSQAKYFLYDKKFTETLVGKLVSENSDFPSYSMQMTANYF